MKRIIFTFSLLLFLVGLFSGGCVSSTANLQFAGYSPDVADRSPWQWNTEKTDFSNDSNTRPNNDIAPNDDINATSISATALKVGDKLDILLTGIPKPSEIPNVVSEKGCINLPFVGSIKVAGLTKSDAETLIEKAYINNGFYKTINVIIVPQVHEYFVRGEVKAPGRYPFSGELTLLQAVTTAGGYTDFANVKKIDVIRGNKILHFDGKKIKEGKQDDILIEPRDIIIVNRSFI